MAINAMVISSLHPSDRRGLRTVALTAACIAALVAGLGYMASAWRDFTVGDTTPLARIGVLLFLAPLLEEVVFRGGLQEALIRRPVGPWAANITTSIAFVAAHLAVHADLAGIAVFLPSLVLGFLYQRTKSIALCALLHAAMNGVWLVIHSTT